MRLDKSKISHCILGFAALALLALVTNSAPTARGSAPATVAGQNAPALAGGGTLVPKRVRLIIGFQQTMPA
jgi:hypothetical protein